MNEALILLKERHPELAQEKLALTKRALEAWDYLKTTGLFKNQKGEDDPKALAKKLGYAEEHCHKVLNGQLPAGKPLVAKLEDMMDRTKLFSSQTEEEIFRSQWADIGEKIIKLPEPAREFVIATIENITDTASKLVHVMSKL